MAAHPQHAYLTRIIRIGNSLGVIIPSDILASLGLNRNDELFITHTESGIEISPYDPDFEARVSAARAARSRLRNTVRRFPLFNKPS